MVVASQNMDCWSQIPAILGLLLPMACETSPFKTWLKANGGVMQMFKIMSLKTAAAR